MVESNISKNIIAIGKTGVGKSTVLNSLSDNKT